MGAMLLNTVTKTKVLEGITVLAANLTVGLVISSAVCIDGSCSSLTAKLPLVPTKFLIDYGKGNHVLKYFQESTVDKL